MPDQKLAGGWSNSEVFDEKYIKRKKVKDWGTFTSPALTQIAWGVKWAPTNPAENVLQSRWWSSTCTDLKRSTMSQWHMNNFD